MSQIQHAAETVASGCDRLRSAVLARDHVPTILTLIEQHRAASLAALGVGNPPGRPADIHKQKQPLWP